MGSSALMGPQDVYAVFRPDGRSSPELSEARISVLLECGPTALSRAFALLCTMNLVPAAARSALAGEEAIRLDLVFESVPQGRIDLLVRKLAQLVECLDVA